MIIVTAREEVILSAGAIESPKLLLLSGVGPSQELSKHKIPIFHDLPGVGKNLDDHLYLFLVSTQKPSGHHRTSHITSPSAPEPARQQWVQNQSGPLAQAYLPQMMAWLKRPKVFASREFAELDEDERKVWLVDTKLTFEIISVRLQTISPHSLPGFHFAQTGNQPRSLPRRTSTLHFAPIYPPDSQPEGTSDSTLLSIA